MAKGPRIDSSVLLNAGLELMRRNGKPLERMPSNGRTMLYKLANGETVRARTCNDHILIVVADTSAENARLNVEGTDWLLIAMPKTERTPGPVIAYLVPSKEAADAARRTHSDWLASAPNTRGDNTTWNLWFDDSGPEKANGFAAEWAKYRLEGSVIVSGFTSSTSFNESSDSATADKPLAAPLSMAEAKLGLAAFYGVSPDAVEITIRG